MRVLKYIEKDKDGAEIQFTMPYLFENKTETCRTFESLPTRSSVTQTTNLKSISNYILMLCYKKTDGLQHYLLAIRRHSFILCL